MPIPKEIKTFIKNLKDKGIGMYNDDKGSRLYTPQDDPKDPPTYLQPTFLRSAFNKACPSSDWEDYSAYILSSLPSLVGFTYHPEQPELTLVNSFLDTYKVNQYTAPDYSVTTIKDITPFTDYLARMFPDAEERHIITQWLAHMFQKPAERPSWHLLITSAQGTGKGYLTSQILIPLLGIRQVSVCEESHSKLFEKHSTHLYQTQLCLIDDCDSTSVRNATGRLKAKFSEEYASVRLPFFPAVTVKIFARMLETNNGRVPRRIDKEDRRTYAPKYITLPDDGVTTAEYLKRMDNFLANENGLEQIYSYFMTYNLDGFNHKFIHQTDTLKEMIGLSESTLEMDMETWLETNKVFKDADLIREFKTSDNYDNQIRNALIKIGGNKTKANLDGKGEARWWLAKGITKEMAKDILTPSLPKQIEVMEVMEVPF